MEAVTGMVDSIAKSTQDLFDGISFHFFNNHPQQRRNPIKILKRLQREAFSDLTKLRERQDKVERILSFYKPSQGIPFQESHTRVRGEVDALGAFIVMNKANQHHLDVIDAAGIKPGIFSRFIFSTTVRRNDTLQAELVSKPNEASFHGNTSGAPLSISKVCYSAHLSDSITAYVVPSGAQYKDLVLPNHGDLNSPPKRSCLGPPLLNVDIGAAIGLTIRKDNFVVSAGQSFSTAEHYPRDEERVISQTSGTFGQLVCKLQSGFELTLLGRRESTKPLFNSKSGCLILPSTIHRRENPATQILEAEDNPNASSSGVFAIKLESPSDVETRISAWAEQRSLSRQNLEWAVNILTEVDDEIGWGFGVGGCCVEGAERKLKTETFMNWNLSPKLEIQPGVVCAVQGGSKILSLTVRSNWSF